MHACMQRLYCHDSSWSLFRTREERRVDFPCFRQRLAFHSICLRSPQYAMRVRVRSCLLQLTSAMLKDRRAPSRCATESKEGRAEGSCAQHSLIRPRYPWTPEVIMIYK
jgi:hypothetical protein